MLNSQPSPRENAKRVIGVLLDRWTHAHAASVRARAAFYAVPVGATIVPIDTGVTYGPSPMPLPGWDARGYTLIAPTRNYAGTPHQRVRDRPCVMCGGSGVRCCEFGRDY